MEKVRSWFPAEASFLGLEAFNWFIIIVIALACWPVYRLIGILLSRLFSSPEKESYPLIRKIFTGPIVLICILFTAGYVVERLGAGAIAQQVMNAKTLATFAILIKIHSFIKTTDFTEFLGIAEEINFQIMEIVKSAGASFALPGRALYMEGDKA